MALREDGSLLRTSQGHVSMQIPQPSQSSSSTLFGMVAAHV